VAEALDADEPDIVLMVWPPDDWTPQIRRLSSVKECIIIGDPTCCGTPLSGNGGYGAYGRSLVHEQPPRPDIYIEDAKWMNAGFSYIWLEELGKIQCGYNWRGDEGQSRTISFQRDMDSQSIAFIK
jgi:hypothetical protein